MAFIGVVCLSSGEEVLIFSISTSWAMLSTFEERISSLYNFSSTLLLKAFWVVIKSLSKVSSSEVEFLVVVSSSVVPIVVGWERPRIVATKVTPISIIVEVVSRDKINIYLLLSNQKI